MSLRRATAVTTASALTTVLVGGLVGPAVGAAAPEPGDDGIGDPYFPLDGNGGIDVTHYDIDVGYDFGSGELTGTTTLTMTATQDLSSFNLDLLLEATGVTVDGVPAQFQQPPGNAHHELAITPATPVLDGQEVEVVVDYADDPSRYRYTGESNWLADGREYVTMNEPHMAPWWFAANDHPLDKATFDVRVTADSDDTVVSNGDLVGSEDAGGGRSVTHWATDEPMATYLAFVAVGDFAVRSGETEGLPWTFAVSRDAEGGAGRKARTWGLRSARTTLALQDVLGEYPFESTGGLVTSLPVGFALENQTRPTYPGLPGTSLLVHELAHQWFGDSVAVAGWKDIWLNEGFATYMQHHVAQVRGGPSTDRWLHRAYRGWAGTSQFWRLDVADPCADGRSCVVKIFDGAVYTRGAMALAALRNVIGNVPFRTLLRTWAADRADGNGSVGQFVDLAEEVADRSLDRFFRVWLSDPRPPRKLEGNGL